MAEDMNWDGIRAEYLAGGVGQRALAAKHGISYYALHKVARAEGWAAMRNPEAARNPEMTGGGGARREEEGRAAGGDAMRSPEAARNPEMTGGGGTRREEEGRAAGGDAEAAMRLRSILLKKLERAANTIPDDATEQKIQDGSTVKLLKLRDLTAAYKELVGDLAADDGAGEENRVVVDI